MRQRKCCTPMSRPAKAPRPQPPELGSFPLDHNGQCRALMLRYLACLERTARDNSQCRADARLYLECRMQQCVCALWRGDGGGCHPGADTVSAAPPRRGPCSGRARMRRAAQ